MDFHIVDVFAEQPLAGNQLAVVLAAGHLDQRQRQALAREFNFSETTFVMGPPDLAGTAVAIHTPAAELPFAGHPTLGTAWVLQQVLAAPAADLVLDLAVGRVPVAADADGVLWLTSPPVAFGPVRDGQAVAAACSLPAAALADDGPVCLADVGPRFLLVPLSHPDHLAGVQLPVAAVGDATGVFFFAADSERPDRVHARMLFDAGGVREDPATGSANCCLAAWLRRWRPGVSSVEVQQGVAMGRPSLLRLQIEEQQLRVGGRVQPVATGSLVV